MDDRTICSYGIYGREVAPTTGTPHLQGFIIFNERKRPRTVREIFVGCDVRIARGNTEQCVNYCKKDGSFVEFGAVIQVGERTDLSDIVNWGREFELLNGRPPTSPDIAQEQPVAYIRYPRLVRLFDHRARPVELQLGEPNAWQQELMVIVENDPDDRSIHFYVDIDGGKGKTWVQRYLLTRYPEKVQLLGIGKRDDIAHTVETTKSIFLINVPRGGMEYLQYTILEQLKDRCVYSPKYNSTMKFFRHENHVIVFCNEEPKMDAMSADRYIIRRL